MKAMAVQLDVQHANAAANRARVADLLQGARADLVVLPELFTTGYLFSSAQQLRPLAEPVGGATTQWLCQLAHQMDAHVVAGIAEVDGENLFNTAVVVNAHGVVGKHRKLHLTRLEKPLFAPGDTLEVFDVGGVRMGVLMCFDIWFAEAARLLVQQGAQVLCHPANFGAPWSLKLACARALENHVCVFTCNRVGNEQMGDIDAHFRGESQWVSPLGEVVAHLGNQQDVLTVTAQPTEPSQRHPMCDDLPREWDRYALALKREPP